MKNKFILLIVMLFSITLSSCEDFLTELPSDSVTTITAITSVSGAETALNALYPKMLSTNYYGRQFLFYADYKGSDLTIFSLGRGDSDLFAFKHEENDGSYSGYWNTMYNCILQVNNVIAKGESLREGKLSTADEKKLNDVLGQAYTLRAIYYFDLVRLYGYPYMKDNGASLGVPIITTVALALDKPERGTVAQVYTQILDDLTTAKSLLAESKSKNNGRINYYAAMTEMARVYLYKGDYDNALTCAKDVIDSQKYKLYTNEEWVSSWKTQFGAESIFELFVSPDDGTDQAKSSPYWYTKAKITKIGTSGCWIASEPFMNRLGEDATDVRWGIMEEDEYALWGINGEGKEPLYIPGRKGSIMKYQGDGKSTTTATNIKVMRLSEVYLIAAEAALSKSSPDKAAAASYLQQIRKRSPGLEPATAANISIDMILDERSKELVLEGHRYFDQLRLGRTVVFDDTTLGEKANYTDFVLYPPESRTTEVDWNYYRAVLPISLEELNANPNMVQNKDY